MRLLPWLANSGNPAMSPSAQEKKRTHHTDVTYPGGNNPEIMLECRMALQQTQGIQAHYGPLTAQIFQH